MDPVNIGPNGTATVIIVDSDGEYCTFFFNFSKKTFCKDTPSLGNGGGGGGMQRVMLKINPFLLLSANYYEKSVPVINLDFYLCFYEHFNSIGINNN